MKKILQKLDSVSTKPVGDAGGMKKFLQIVSEKETSVLNEGTAPHKVSLPVQMAMQHYQHTQEQSSHIKSPIKPGVRKFFKEVEIEQVNQVTEKKQLLRQYASTIAERVMMKEFKEVDRRDQDESGWQYKGDNPLIKNMISKATADAPGAQNDLEALVINQSMQNDINDRQQDTVEKQQADQDNLLQMYGKLQDIQDSAEDRFRELNAKVASGDITDQDIAAAQAAQEIEKQVDTEKQQVRSQSNQLGNKEIPKPVINKSTPVAQSKPQAVTTPQAVQDPRMQSQLQATQQALAATRQGRAFDNLSNVTSQWAAKSAASTPTVATPVKQPVKKQSAKKTAMDVINKAKNTPVDALASMIEEDAFPFNLSNEQMAEANADIIRNGLRSFVRSVTITLSGEPVTIWAAQMFAVTMTLGQIKDPKKKAHTKMIVLTDKTEFGEFLYGPARKFVPAYDGWLEKQKEIQRKERQGQGSLPGMALENEIKGHSMGFTGGVGPGLQNNEPIEEMPIVHNPDRPHNPRVVNHKKFNSHELMTLISMAARDLHRVAELAQKANTSQDDETKLIIWKQISGDFSQGGVVGTLADRVEQIRHATEELATARRSGKNVAPKVRKQISPNLSETDIIENLLSQGLVKKQ
jgi:hypothetical protein